MLLQNFNTLLQNLTVDSGQKIDVINVKGNGENMGLDSIHHAIIKRRFNQNTRLENHSFKMSFNTWNTSDLSRFRSISSLTSAGTGTPLCL